MQSSLIVILGLCVAFALLPATRANETQGFEAAIRNANESGHGQVIKCYGGLVRSRTMLPSNLEIHPCPGKCGVFFSWSGIFYHYHCRRNCTMVNKCIQWSFAAGAGANCCCEGELCNGNHKIRRAAEQAEWGRSGGVEIAFVNVRTCDELVITNGKTVPAGVSFGKTVNVSCNFGYQPTAAQVTCNLGAFTAVHCEQRCILLIGGTGDYDPEVDLVEYYHPTKDEGCDVAAIGNMSTMNVSKVERSSACFMADTEKILIRESNNPPMVYGLANSSATQLPPPYKHRGNAIMVHDTVTVAVNGSSCISCGGVFKNAGNGNYAYLRVCRQFDSLSSKWTSVPSMPQVSAASASVWMSATDFYVIGGSHGLRRSNDLLFRYDVTARTWHTEASINEKRHLHSAAPLSATEFIVCGGYDKRKSCEIYCTTTKTWRCGGYMKVSRHSFQMFNFNGQVYALGGIGAGSQWGNTPLAEKYDQATNSWSIAKPLKHERHQFVAVAV